MKPRSMAASSPTVSPLSFCPPRNYGVCMTEEKKRLKASREIGKALRAVQAIQMLYRIMGGLTLAVAALAVRADAWTVGQITAGAGTLLLIGSVQVREHPGHGPWAWRW